MTKWLLVAILLNLFVGPSLAQVFTCRDADGRLYAGDNLQALPESCRAKVKKLPEQAGGNLNYVPAADSSPGASHDFKREVTRAQQDIAQREKREQDLLRRARTVAAQYQQAERDKWTARKDLTTRSRGAYDEALKKQQELLKEKADILNEINKERISAASREQIMSDLEGLENK